MSRTHTLLILDTSTDQLVCSVAELRVHKGMCEHTLLSCHDHLCARQANVELTSTIQEALVEAGRTMQDLTAILVGKGPGSFTGVRIGIATAKGIAQALELPLLGVSVLDGIAAQAHRAGIRGHIVVFQDAMRKELYPGIYRLSDEGSERLFAIETVHKVPEALAHVSQQVNLQDVYVAGNGICKYRAQMEEAGFTQYLDEALWEVSGVGLLAAALDRGVITYDDQDIYYEGNPATLLPIYTRLSDAEEAERLRLGKHAARQLLTTGVNDELAGSIQFRPFNINDVAAAAALEAQVYAESDHNPWSEQTLYDEVTAARTSWWIAHDRGKLVAFAGGSLAGADFDIAEVVVDPAYRRRSVARTLLERVAYDAFQLGAERLVLEVAENNMPAQALYNTLGLTQVGLRKHYYAQGVHALLLACDLPLQIPATAGQSASALEGSNKYENTTHEAETPRTSALDESALNDEVEELRRRHVLQSAGALILAVESSCDETAMAIITEHGELCASVVATQIDFHARFGGVVPEIASRKHTEAISGVFDETLALAAKHLGISQLKPSDLAAVGATTGPGLVGALVVGLAFAKGLSCALDIPLIACHHLEGHLLANLFEQPDLEPPFVASLVSGGNTMLIHVKRWGEYEVLGSTIDDAVGEAFDKVAKVLGLGYPGGPLISRLAETGNPQVIAFPRALLHSKDYAFSLSGLKTAVMTYIDKENKAGRPINLPDLAASFEQAVIDVQVAKALRACTEYGVKHFCVGGGVAANKALRRAYEERFSQAGITVSVPPLKACGDNAAMIALVALRSYRAGYTHRLTLDADPNAPLQAWAIPYPPIPPQEGFLF